ncbi:hypothetical protein [Nocardiopsis tropica]|uniref:Uncharacterized protein n=1 Tax=Nocardiopsis tropica TaxID=109330 RepID=A0ABU7L0C1_9ACTN|nr:hypothetical protein [Nocardiopsis umidischolae]MEE2054772.1 hypothetical protein [Nocardiopsis umidischolae]
MKRTDRPTRKSMAVRTRLSYQIQTRLAGGGSAWLTVAEVLWARERDGVRTVFLGELRGFQEQKATSAAEWMDLYVQPMERRRSASYNGVRFWHRGAGLDSHEDILRRFHATGELPAGFEGWWTPGASQPPGGYIHEPRVDDPTVALCATNPLMLISDGPTNADGSDRMCPVCVTKKAVLAGHNA